jgi:hypothetical protein
MKSVEARFRKFQKKSSSVGEFVVLMQTVHGQKFGRETVSKWFYKLVPQDDFARSERHRLINQLYLHSNTSEEGEN